MNLLTDKQQHLYDSFYESTHNNDFINSETEILVGLSAALAMNCSACTSYYLKKAKKADISKGAISEVIAKVMAVSAGQKKLQAQDIIDNSSIDFDSFK